MLTGSPFPGQRMSMGLAIRDRSGCIGARFDFDRTEDDQGEAQPCQSPMTVTHDDADPNWRDTAIGALILLATLALIVFLTSQLVDVSVRMLANSASQTAALH